MSTYRNLEMFCLRKADQISHAMNIIWAAELGENINEDDVKITKEYFTEDHIQDLKGSYSFSEFTPKIDTPEEWNKLLEIKRTKVKLVNLSEWKRYFFVLSSYYLSKANEYSRMEDNL